MTEPELIRSPFYSDVLGMDEETPVDWDALDEAMLTEWPGEFVMLRVLRGKLAGRCLKCGAIDLCGHEDDEDTEYRTVIDPREPGLVLEIFDRCQTTTLVDIGNGQHVLDLLTEAIKKQHHKEIVI